jgi:predicted ATPase with chaperone activity
MIKRKPTAAAGILRSTYGGIIRLSDPKLLRLRDEATAEIVRRCPADHPIDLSDIRGQECAKHALLIAIAGKHSILLLGSPGCGKSMLRSVARQFGLLDTFEARSCPCGYANDPRHACRCTASQIHRHLAKLPDTDVTVEVPPVPAREWQSKMKGTSSSELQRQLDGMGAIPPLVLDDTGSQLLRTAASEQGLSAAVLDRTMRIAATIAALDHSAQIGVSHVCEAINYQRIQRC